MNLEYLSFRSKRRFGVEIEVNRHHTQNKLAGIVNDALGEHLCEPSGWGYSCNNEIWAVKPDSSCGDLGHKDQDGGGYEVASAVGHGPRHLDDIEKVTAALQTAKAEVNNFCGLHVQVEIKDFDDERAATLLALWCRIEPVISHAVPKRRTESHHCRFHTKNKKLWPSAQRATSAKEFWGIMKLKSLGAPAKRNTITLVNYQRTKSHSYEWDYFNRSTVELRIPESSLDAYHVKNWARLFVHFVETASRKPFPSTLKVARFDEVLEILGLKSVTAECSVLSPGLFETKCWFLRRLKEYARSQQVSRVVSRYWQEIVAPTMQWRFAFPQVEQPFVQVLPPVRTKSDNGAPSPASRGVCLPTAAAS
jgi:hypothetical protein